MSFELRWMGAVGVGVGESRLEGGSKPKLEGEALIWVGHIRTRLPKKLA